MEGGSRGEMGKDWLFCVGFFCCFFFFCLFLVSSPEPEQGEGKNK